MSDEQREVLQSGARALGVGLSREQEDQLLDYLGWIQRWNRVYNLTAVRSPAEMMTHHLLDSLAVVPSLQRWVASRASTAPLRVLDVGSGAGLPGIVLAIVCPDWDVTCVDTVQKKALFIQQVGVSLRLPRLRALHARVETLTQPHDLIVSRAFASVHDFVTWSRSALDPVQGQWLAMKGRFPEAELRALPPGVKVDRVEPLQVPGLDAERCAVWLSPDTVS